MKKLITITLLILLNACGSDDEAHDDTLVVESSISEGTNLCYGPVRCYDACGSDSTCAQKCFKNLSGTDIEKSFILMTCRDTYADDCLTDNCRKNECRYAIAICEGKEKYGCAQILECAGKCFTQRCEDECQNIGTPKAISHIEEINVCVNDYCSYATSDLEMSGCVKTNCKGSLLACANN